MKLKTMHSPTFRAAQAVMALCRLLCPFGASPVAQVASLLYRRLPACRRRASQAAVEVLERLPFGNRRNSRLATCATTFALLVACASFREASAAPARPNVVVIITDDQGYGDLGIHGNPDLQTPNLDRFAKESARFSNFYVSPVCSPTRASLMTGRYNYRTGVIDTFLGRSMMHGSEVTLAEMLREHGYRTGIFGKWHLGDNYPMRPNDQGFEEALVHKGGGIGQPSDPPGGESYFDPVLQHNGKQVQATGYCSDIFTSAAIRFVEANRRKPMFVWLAFNAPHTPLQAPERYYNLYKGKDLLPDRSPRGANRATNNDAIARIYGMVQNIDHNVGRLLSRLHELRVATNTIVIFLTDNGPQQARYNSGMRGLKGSVYEGGIRVPFFVRWPNRIPAGQVDALAAHIDFAPTILEACGIPPKGPSMDGRSLWLLLTAQSKEWPERTLFFQWHRGDVPELFRAFAVRTARYKLVQSSGVQRPAAPKYELFDVSRDRQERHDIAADQPELRDRLLRDYEQWFKDVTSGTNNPPRIMVGDPQENPTVLTRQDWRGPQAGWSENSIGHWDVDVRIPGTYTVKVHQRKLDSPAKARLTIGGASATNTISAASHTFTGLFLSAGPTELHCTIEANGKVRGIDFVEIRRD